MILACLQKRHGCFVVHRYFARAVLVFVACCCAHQLLNQCTTRALCRGYAGKTRARAFRVLRRTGHARQTLVAEVLRTGWHAWRSLPSEFRAAPIDVGHLIPPRRPSTSRRDAVSAPPVDAPRPVSERKPRSRLSRVPALGADHGNRQRGKGVGVEEGHLRPPGGRRWQPPT